MRRWLVLAAAVGIGVALVAALVIRSRLDGLVRDALERRGSQMTETSVRVESVHVSLAGGSATVRGITVANPPGFTAPHAFVLDEVSVRVALRSALSDPLVIGDVRIQSPRVYCELDAAGKTNIERLRRSVERAERRTGTRRAPADAPRPDARRERRQPRRLIIERLAFHEGEVHLDATAVGGPARRETLPGFELVGIGAAHGGATPDEVGRILVTAIARDVAVAVAATQLERFIGKALGGHASKLFKRGGAEAIERGLGDVLDRLLRK